MTTRPVPAWEPLGRALVAAHEGRQRARLVVESDLWETEEVPVADYYRPDDRPLPALETRALAACGRRVLDLGAGAGRHALELARRGHEVVAVDVSPHAVEVMRARGVTDARTGGLETVAGETFDTVLMLMHGLGLVGSRHGLVQLLERLPDLLDAGGGLVTDSADLAAEVDPVVLAERAATGDPGEVRFRLSFERFEGAPYPWLFVAAPELDATARAAGLDCEVLGRGERGAYLARLSRR